MKRPACCRECPGCHTSIHSERPHPPSPDGTVHRCRLCGQMWGQAPWPPQNPRATQKLHAWLAERAIPLD